MLSLLPLHRPVLRPVGRLGRPPQVPLRGDSPVVCPRRPPLHQFPDGGAWRPVQFNAGHWLGVSLRDTWCTFVLLLAPSFPLLPRGPVPRIHLLFLFSGCLSCRAHRCSRAPCVCPLLLSALPLPRRPVPSPPVTPFLPSPPPIRCHSEGPVCTFPSTLTAFAVHSPVCATRGFHLCPTLLPLPFPLVSGHTLTLPTLMCYRPPTMCYALLPRFSPLPGRHRFRARGSVNMRTGLRPCLWTG